MKQRCNSLGFLGGLALSTSLGLFGVGMVNVNGAEAGADGAAHSVFTPAQIQFFEESVRPILKDNCEKCHGGTDSAGKVKIRGNLQLISRLGIIKGGDHGAAFDAVEPEKSLFLKMISYEDEDHQMPPNGKLPEEQIVTLTEWVTMGMPWTPSEANRLIEPAGEALPTTKINDLTRNYWSYKALEPVEPPEVSDPEWNSNPLDAFIFRQLEANGLKPNPKASKETLIRRAYYNLTGLPPTPEEVAEFVEDDRCDAWSRCIDRLLEKPQYGETWARHWLDLVRYAESNGFERDSEKQHIWRYRDYVVKSFNDDKPYDQFIREQLAGDELDPVTLDSQIATGFFRLMQWDDEPADRKQHVYDVLDDNVRVTAEVFMGMTVGCARCHDHKGDPISQKDYYSLLSFFHNVTHMDKNNVIGYVDTPETQIEKERLERERENKVAELLSERSRLETIATQRIRQQQPGLLEKSDSESHSIRFIKDSREEGQEWHYSFERPSPDWFSVGFVAKDWYRGKAGFGNGNPPNTKTITKWSSPEIWMRRNFGIKDLPKEGVLELTLYHDEDVEVYLNGERVLERKGYVTEYQTIALPVQAMNYLQTGNNVLAIHCRQTGGGQFIDAGLRVVLGENTVRDILKSEGNPFLTETESKAYRQVIKELGEWEGKDIRTGIPVMRVQEFGREVRPTYIHIRGNASAEGDEVKPAFPSIFGGEEAVIPPLPEGYASSGRRKVLAEWITKKDHPRTSRVMVNRIWQYHFGRGLCPTSSDFGFLGDKATHPELLDWLAGEFVRRGWSLKEMHRLIMNSMAYQMSSEGNEVSLAKDPQNNHLWRFDMRRLTAEEVRDSIIRLAGKLNLKVGGPSFYSELPQEVIETSSMGMRMWGVSPQEEVFRRSLYIRVKRSMLTPVLLDYDFADTDSSCPVRFVSTVPTQALSLLNSQFIGKYARLFAEELEGLGLGSTEAQVRRAFEVALSRPVRPDEVQKGLSLIEDLISRHGNSPREALEGFCLMVMNLNEFVYLD